MSPAYSIFWYSNRIVSEIGLHGESKATNPNIPLIPPSDTNSIASSKLDSAPLAPGPQRRPMAVGEHTGGSLEGIKKRDSDDIETDKAESEVADSTGPGVPLGTADPSLYPLGSSAESTPSYTYSNLVVLASPTAAVFTETPTTIPSEQALPGRVEHLGLYISAGVVAFIAIVSALACLMRRWRRHRSDGFIASGHRWYRRHRLKQQGFINLDSEKAQLHHMNSSQTAERPPSWDPEATFAKPLSKPPKALRRASDAFSKIQYWGSRPFLRKDAPPTPRRGCYRAPPSIAKVVTTESTDQAIPQAPKSPTNSTNSSTVLGPAQPAVSLNPPTIRNFSWCTPHHPSTIDVSSPHRGGSPPPSYVSKELR